MEEIKSISEAFSMQPAVFYVVTEAYMQQLDKQEYKEVCVKEIKLEYIQVDSDKACNFYVGYNFEGKKVFQYLASSVNVHFKN